MVIEFVPKHFQDSILNKNAFFWNDVLDCFLRCCHNVHSFSSDPCKRSLKWQIGPVQSLACATCLAILEINPLANHVHTWTTYWQMNGGEICYQNSCQSQFSGAYLVFEVFQERGFKKMRAASFHVYRRVSRFGLFQTNVAHCCFCLVLIKKPFLIWLCHCFLLTSFLRMSRKHCLYRGFEPMVYLSVVSEYPFLRFLKLRRTTATKIWN